MPTSGFDASKYLTNLRGKEYLEVKWRLLWLRTQHPDAMIETELVKHDAGLALFRARVRVPGGGSATGWGSETVDDFGDFIEKAETKALGRALAALGFGTQFCEDFNFGGADAGAARDTPVVDAPVASRRLKAVRDGGVVASSSADANSGSAGAALPRGTQARRAEGASSSIRQSATSSQINAIMAIAREQHALGEANVEERCRATYGCPPGELSKQQASEFIVQLRRRGARPGEQMNAKQANRRQRQPA